MQEMYPTRDIWLGSLFLTESKARLVDVQIGGNPPEQRLQSQSRIGGALEKANTRPMPTPWRYIISTTPTVKLSIARVIITTPKLPNTLSVVKKACGIPKR